MLSRLLSPSGRIALGMIAGGVVVLLSLYGAIEVETAGVVAAMITALTGVEVGKLVKARRTRKKLLEDA